MKKTFLLAIATLIVVTASAQIGRRQKRDRFNHSNVEQYYGLRLGLNVSSISSGYTNYDMSSRAGINFGAVYGLQLANSTPLWLEGGVYFSEKGGKNDSFITTVSQGGTEQNVSQKVETRLTYLQVPVVIKYAFDIADDLYLQPFFGGYLALGIGGKTKEYGTTYSQAGTTYTLDRHSHSSYDYFNRLDGGLRLGCGIEYQMVYAEAGFDFGLANITGDDFDSAHNMNFFLTAGVNF